MLQDIRDGKVGPVVTWHLESLHRQSIGLEHFMALADEHRIALATVTGDVDLSTDNGRLIARITGAVARAEVECKSARQKTRCPSADRAGARS
jgi:site-specific DNA recombinase